MKLSLQSLILLRCHSHIIHFLMTIMPSYMYICRSLYPLDISSKCDSVDVFCAVKEFTRSIKVYLIFGAIMIFSKRIEMVVVFQLLLSYFGAQ